jgi:hypothetical protein
MCVRTMCYKFVQIRNFALTCICRSDFLLSFFFLHFVTELSKKFFFRVKSVKKQLCYFFAEDYLRRQSWSTFFQEKKCLCRSSKRSLAEMRDPCTPKEWHFQVGWQNITWRRVASTHRESFLRMADFSRRNI